MGGITEEPSRRLVLDELGPLEELWALGGAARRSFDALAKLAAEMAGTSMAAVTVVDSDQLVFIGAAGLPVRTVGSELSFCAGAIDSSDEVLVVPDAWADEQFATTALVVGVLRIRFYAGVPLITGDGVPIGTICVLDGQPHQLSADQLSALTSLAQLAVELLDARRAATRLATTNAQLRHSQAAQQDARDQFQTVFDHAPLGMTLADDQGNYLRVNATFARLLGLPVDQVVGQSFARFTPNGIDGDVQAIGDLVNGEGGSSVREKTYQRADGTTFPALVTTSLIRPTESGSWLLLSQVESLAERRAAEASMLEVQSAVDGIITVNRAGRVTSWNLGAERLLGYPAHSMLGQTLTRVLPTHLRDDNGDWLAGLTNGADAIQIVGTIEAPAVRADGQQLLVELSLSGWEQAGSPRYTAVLRDITARSHAQALVELVAHAARTANEAGLLAEAAPAVIAAVCSHLGWTAGHAWCGPDTHANWHVVRHRHPTQRPCALKVLAAAGSRPNATQLPVDQRTRVARDRAGLNGSDIEDALVICDIGSAVAVPVLAGTDTGGILALYLPTDATPPDPETITALEQIGLILGRVVERERRSALIRHQAAHDPLTGLANRPTLLKHIAATQTGLAAGLLPGKHAVLMLDMDRFRLINESLGHIGGDTMLQEAAHRIAACTRPGDLTARLGGDEFAVLTHDHPDDDSIMAYAQQLLAKFTGIVTVADTVVPLRASLGVSPISVEAASTGHDPASVLSEADQALRQAKRRGKGRVEMFDSALRNHAAVRLRAETDLELAISTDQLAVHYQPIIDLNTAELAGAEALVRWHRPDHGMILPAHFIPLAEESGLIVDLGRWVLHRACTDAAQWSRTAPALAESAVSVKRLGPPTDPPQIHPRRAGGPARCRPTRPPP